MSASSLYFKKFKCHKSLRSIFKKIIMGLRLKSGSESTGVSTEHLLSLMHSSRDSKCSVVPVDSKPEA